MGMTGKISEQETSYSLIDPQIKKAGWNLSDRTQVGFEISIIEAYKATISIPFEAESYNRIAVKIMDDRGIESSKILGID